VAQLETFGSWSHGQQQNQCCFVHSPHQTWPRDSYALPSTHHGVPHQDPPALITHSPMPLGPSNTYRTPKEYEEEIGQLRAQLAIAQNEHAQLLQHLTTFCQPITTYKSDQDVKQYCPFCVRQTASPHDCPRRVKSCCLIKIPGPFLWKIHQQLAHDVKSPRSRLDDVEIKVLHGLRTAGCSTKKLEALSGRTPPSILKIFSESLGCPSCLFVTCSQNALSGHAYEHGTAVLGKGDRLYEGSSCWLTVTKNTVLENIRCPFCDRIASFDRLAKHKRMCLGKKQKIYRSDVDLVSRILVQNSYDLWYHRDRLDKMSSDEILQSCKDDPLAKQFLQARQLQNNGKG
jgi:hypothetical protein